VSHIVLAFLLGDRTMECLALVSYMLHIAMSAFRNLDGRPGTAAHVPSGIGRPTCGWATT
jgi:hypothetical protein